MRRTVAKRLSKIAARMKIPTEVRTKQFGIKTTICYTGYKRIYRNLKKQWRKLSWKEKAGMI